MRTVVVGGAGFVGSHLVDRIIADGNVVDVVDDLSSGSLANLADARAMGGSLKIHHLDAAGDEAASLIGMRQPDVIYHLAALPRGPVDDSRYVAALPATYRLIEAARDHRVAKIVVALPASVMYGHPASRALPVKEQPVEPRGVRGIAARAIVDLLTEFREQFAVEFTVLALGSVYGPRQRATDGVVAAFVDAVRSGRTPQIPGHGRMTRDFVFVDDVVDALVRAGSRGSGLIVNVGTGVQTSLDDLWRAIAGSGTTPPEFTGSGDLVRFALSPVRARIHLSWSPWTTLDDGLRQVG